MSAPEQRLTLADRFVIVVVYTSIIAGLLGIIAATALMQGMPS